MATRRTTPSPTTRPSTKALVRALTALTVLLAAAACGAIKINEPPGTRFGTAAALATEAFPDGADVVLLTNGTSFPDALAAAPLAARRGAPILLTQQATLPDETQDALDDLGPSEVILLGGEAAVGDAVEEALPGGLDVRRISGDDRYDTAAQVATAAFPGGADIAVLATGESFADALAAAPLAERHDAPILLTGRDALPQETLDALDQLGASRVLLLGGTAVIGQAVEDFLGARGADVRRISGADRYETAALLAEAAFPDGAETALLATGASFADALAAAPLAAHHDGPILLSQPDRVPAATTTALQQLGVDDVVVLGGPAAISDLAHDVLAEGPYDVRRRAGG